MAILNISSLSPGAHAITVTYGGATDFSGSTSPAYTHVVNAPLSVTSTQLVSSQNPSFAGQNVILTTTVSTTSSGTPSGTIAFYDGTTLIGTQILSAGSASMTTSALSIGTHSLIAIYMGNSTFAPSSSSTLAQVVQKAPSTTSLIASINPTQYGQATLLTASVGVNSAAGIATGTISFYDGVTLLGTLPINGGGASLSIANLSSGNHSLTASYSGDIVFNGSNSLPYGFVVTPATTEISLSSSENPASLSEPVTFTASLFVPAGAGSPTGTVTFFDGVTNLGTSSISAGKATLTVSSLTLGVHSITASYSGDSNFASSLSDIYSQTIAQKASTTLLSSNLNPSMFGQEITLTASVSVGSSPTPATGSITFYDGPFFLGTTSLTAGSASLSVSNLIVDSHALSAVYSGDLNYSSSTSPLYIQYVLPATTVTAISSSSDPIIFGAPVTFTATVTPQEGNAVPIGLVSFREGSKILGSTPLIGGVATFTTSDLTSGGHLISAIYLGNPDFRSSISATMTQTVDQGTVTAQLASSLNPAMYVDNIILSATVSVATGSGMPTGSVTFFDGATPIGVGNLSGNIATLFLSQLSVASHTLTAVYSGDDNFSGATSPPLTQVINQALSEVNILASIPDPSIFGTNVTFFAVVSGEGGLPTGTVTFYDGASPLGTVNVQEGIVIFEINTLSVGTHTVTAQYNGDINFAPSTSGPHVQTVNQINITVTTLTTLTSSLNPSNYGETVLFNVDVIPLAGPGTPTGVVTLYSGADPIVTLPLVNGAASYSTDQLPAGILTIVALYSGDADFSASTTTLPQTVNAITTTTTVSSSLSPASVFSPVTFTAQVTAASGAVPAGTVSFYDGTSLLGTFLLDGSGEVAMTTSSLAVGTHTINVVFNASQNFVTSSDSTTQIITPLATSSLLFSASNNPSALNERVTFTAVVSADVGTPSGVVTFYDGISPIGTVQLQNGSAVLMTADLAPGPHTIMFTYGGSTNYNSSTSNAYTQNVNKPTSSVNITSSVNPSAFGQSIDLIATVSGSTMTSPTGDVAFYDGQLLLGTANIHAGVATISIANLSVTAHSLTAYYTGDATYSESTSSIYVQYVTMTQTATTLTSSLNPSAYGAAVSFTATVSSLVGASTPVGLVSFYDGVTFLGEESLNGAIAVFTTSALTPGAHSITAIYQESSSFLSSTSPSLIQNVDLQSSSTSLMTSINPSSFGDLITLTASVDEGTGSGMPTGNVTFFDGATPIGAAPLINGIATLSTSRLSFGTHLLQASYSGDNNFEGSTSATLSQVVNAAATEINIVSSTPNPSMLTQTVTFFATVSASSGAPDGTISFFDGQAFLGTVTLFEGLAIFSTDQLTVGTHSITAQYNGTDSYAPAVSTPVTQTVLQNSVTQTSVVSLLSSNNPSTYGESVTFDINVSPLAGTGTPTGNVTLYSGSTPLAIVALVDGSAHFTTSYLPAGPNTMVALYSGDSVFSPATVTLFQEVLAAPTSIVLTSSIANAPAFSPITFTAQVKTRGVELSTGSVSFYANSSLLGTSSLNNRGLATLTTSNLPIDNYIIEAVYNGAENYLSSSTSIQQTVSSLATNVLIMFSSPNPSKLNENVAFFASVVAAEGVPTGNVEFYDNEQLIGTAPLLNGLALFTTSSLPVGSHAITARYLGALSFNPSVSQVYTQVVNESLVKSKTLLVSSENPAKRGDRLIFKAKVTSKRGTPKGTVTFFSGSHALGTSILIRGKATLKTSALTVGCHYITAVYNGNSKHLPSTSNSLVEEILPIRTLPYDCCDHENLESL